MPTIAVIDGVRIVIYLKDHLPPHLHAIYGDHEAQISIATGDVLNGALPNAKRQAVQSWLAANREVVSHVWVEIRAHRYKGGRID